MAVLRAWGVARLVRLAGCLAGLIASQAGAAVDATFIGTPKDASGQDIAPYDIEYAAARLEFGAAANTPEADARPGEYYFLEGAHAFLKKDYAFAIQMYEVAASWAYKPAEYNLGVMYARGQGVPADLSRGLAWMALAAERNEQHYVDAREAVYAAMTPEQFAQANVIWRELKKTYGDAVALRRARARWAQVRAGATGSHVGAIGNLQVGAPSGERAGASSPQYPSLTTGFEETEHNPRGPQVGANPIKGFKINSSGPTTAGEALAGRGEAGSISYRRLRESDDPYDPKFRTSIGTAMVGQPEPAKADAPKPTAKDDSERGNQ
jgi:hypothetical protein